VWALYLLPIVLVGYDLAPASPWLSAPVVVGLVYIAVLSGSRRSFSSGTLRIPWPGAQAST